MNQSDSGRGVIEYAFIVLIITLVVITATAVGSTALGAALDRAFIRIAEVLR